MRQESSEENLAVFFIEMLQIPTTLARQTNIYDTECNKYCAQNANPVISWPSTQFIENDVPSWILLQCIPLVFALLEKNPHPEKRQSVGSMRTMSQLITMAVTVGFEPTVGVNPHNFSRVAPSAARTRHHEVGYYIGG